MPDSDVKTKFLQRFENMLALAGTILICVGLAQLFGRFGCLIGVGIILIQLARAPTTEGLPDA